MKYRNNVSKINTQSHHVFIVLTWILWEQSGVDEFSGQDKLNIRVSFSFCLFVGWTSLSLLHCNKQESEPILRMLSICINNHFLLIKTWQQSFCFEVLVRKEQRQRGPERERSWWVCTAADISVFSLVIRTPKKVLTENQHFLSCSRRAVWLPALQPFSH